MKIIERPPIAVALPSGRLIHIATQRWELERWEGAPDPPDLARAWAIKPKFAVESSRSCAELAIVHHWRAEGWHGI